MANINQVIKNNKNINENIKEIIHESYDEIFLTLGKNNFLRWINSTNIADKLKNMIIEEFSAKDIEKEPKGVTGYFNNSQNAIRLRNPNDKNSATHEILHSISYDANNSSKEFPKFIDEGLTEYLNGIVSGGSVSYDDNVQLARFLHKTMGDSLIKCYLLTGPDKNFEERFAKLLSFGGDEPKKEDLDNFYKDVNIIHTSKYGDKTKYDEGKINVAYSQYYQYIENIGNNYIKEKSKNIEYYKNGTLDLELIADDLESTIKDIFSITKMPQENRKRFYDKFYVKNLRTILNNSHLRNKENINAIVWQIYKTQMVIEKTNPENLDYTANNNVIRIDEDSFHEILERNNQDIPDKLAHIRLALNKNIYDENGINIPEFISEIALIGEKTNMTSDQRNRIIGTELFNNSKYIPENVEAKVLINLIRKNLEKINSLSNLERINEKNNIDDKFIKLGKDKYIHKADGRFFYLEIDDDGKIKEQPLIINGSIDGVINYYINLNNIYISLNIDTNNNNRPFIMVNGRNIKNIKEINDFKDLKEEVFTDSVKEIISDRKYYSINDDEKNPYKIPGVSYTGEVDLRSRSLKFESLSSDLSKLINLVPKGKRDSFIEEIVEEKVSKCFGTTRNDLSGGNYNQIIDIIKFDVLNNREITPREMRSLELCNSKLNEIRKERVERSNNTSLVHFENDEAKQRYINNLKREKRTKEEKRHEKVEEISSLIIKNYKSYLYSSEPFEEIQKSKKGYDIVGSFNILEENHVDLDKLTMELSRFASKLKPEEREEVLKNTILDFLNKAYGSTKKSIDEDTRKQREEVYESLEKQLLDKVLHDKDIDILQYKNDEEDAIEISRNELHEALKKSLYMKRTISSRKNNDKEIDDRLEEI